MAQRLVSNAVIFFLFLSSLALSDARIPSNLPENDVTDQEFQILRQEYSDDIPTIRLPSETSSYELEVESANEEAKTATNIDNVASVPLKPVRFRPINRHFRVRSSFPSRLCRHHHHHHLNFRPLEQHDDEEIPCGNDMILSNNENADFNPMFFRSGPQRVPPTWHRIHHQHHYHDHDEFDDQEDDENEVLDVGIEKFSKINGKGKGKMFKNKRFHRDQDHEEAREEAVKDDVKRKKEDQEGGFLNHFRKFLNQFEI